MSILAKLFSLILVTATFASTAIAQENVLAAAPIATSETTVGAFYNWGRSNDGYGRCYLWADNGSVLNEGNPVSSYYCEAVSPSQPRWGRSNDGYGRCFLYTLSGLVLNEGSSISAYRCEAVSPSVFRWGRGNDGYTRCYQYSRSGLVLNEGNAVPNYRCQ